MIRVTLTTKELRAEGHAEEKAGPEAAAVCASTTVLLKAWHGLARSSGWIRSGHAHMYYGRGNAYARFVVHALRMLARGRGEYITIEGRAPWEKQRKPRNR